MLRYLCLFILGKLLQCGSKSVKKNILHCHVSLWTHLSTTQDPRRIFWCIGLCSLPSRAAGGGTRRSAPQTKELPLELPHGKVLELTGTAQQEAARSPF